MNERILFVEDDDSLRESATRVLERVGFSVTAVADGQEALDTFNREGGGACFTLVLRTAPSAPRRNHQHHQTSSI